MRKVVPLALFSLLLAACSSTPEPAKATSAAAAVPTQAVDSKNPAAKYIELVGFRMREKGSGKLEVTFAVVNHSEADLGDLTLNVNLRTSTAKPAEPPVCSFTAKVPALGPEDLKQVTADIPTKLRVYELPDWQFLRPEFRIVEPK